MHYEGSEYVIRASLGRDGWTLLIYFPEQGRRGHSHRGQVQRIARGGQWSVEGSIIGLNDSDARKAAMISATNVRRACYHCSTALAKSPSLERSKVDISQ
jgi:hypothetical protein